MLRELKWASSQPRQLLAWYTSVTPATLLTISAWHGICRSVQRITGQQGCFSTWSAKHRFSQGEAAARLQAAPSLAMVGVEGHTLTLPLCSCSE